MIRRPFAAIACALSVTALACHSAGADAGRTLIRHDFTDSAQGWIVSGDTRPAEAVFSRTGGHPGGCITGVDEALGETWHFLAPPSVLQQLPKAVNGTISYSLKQSGPIISLFDDDVVIVGPAGRLSYRFPTAPGTDWTDFSVQLSATAGLDVELEPARHASPDRAGPCGPDAAPDPGRIRDGGRHGRRWTISR